MNIDAARALRFAGKAKEAIDALQRAIIADPTAIPERMELALCLRAVGRQEDAREAVEQAVRLRPFEAGLHLALGGCLKSLGRSEEAAVSCRRALELEPTLGHAYNNLGACLHELGRLSEVETVFRQGLRFVPSQADFHGNLAWCLYLQGRLPESIAEYRAALAIEPSWLEAHSRLLFVMLHDPGCSPAQNYAEHLAWARIHADPLSIGRVPPASDADPRRRLRVGYLSSDFRDNAMMSFIEPLLANHDHNAFEITCYADVPDADAVTVRTRGLVDHWRDIAGQSDEQAARQIRADGIDILVELSGHNAGHLLKIMARKPAPVLVGNLGYAHSTGVRAIDYRIVDQYSDPPGMTEAFYAEKIVRLKHTNWVYRPPADAPDVAPVPCIANGYITFGSFNVLPKITPDVVALWSRILLAVPQSRLALKSLGFSDRPTRTRFINLFESHGIDSARLDFLNRTPSRAAHLEEYGRLDIALDPFPYNGTTTTCEALWMGVPVIALAGRAHADRVSLSLLHNLGMPELIGQSADDYVRIAKELAADRPRLLKLRSTLRDQVSRSPLRDESGFARAMENEYRAMWQTWCSRAQR